jgi:hypothetical protein
MQYHNTQIRNLRNPSPITSIICSWELRLLSTLSMFVVFAVDAADRR